MEDSFFASRRGEDVRLWIEANSKTAVDIIGDGLAEGNGAGNCWILADFWDGLLKCLADKGRRWLNRITGSEIEEFQALGFEFCFTLLELDHGIWLEGLQCGVHRNVTLLPFPR